MQDIREYNYLNFINPQTVEINFVTAETETQDCVSSGWKGNVCERSLASGVSLLLLAPCAALAVYLMLLQTLVLRLELLLSAVLLTFYLLELLLGLLALSAFSRLANHGEREWEEEEEEGEGEGKWL